MRHADQALEEDALLLILPQELAKRCQKSQTRGRQATPAEVVLRMLLLKPVRDGSYATLSREVRAPLVYREFPRMGGEKVPEDRTRGNLARPRGPEVVEKRHGRVVEMARKTRSPPVVRGGSIRPWWRPTSILQRTALYGARACASGRAS